MLHCPDYCPSSQYDHGLRQSNGKNNYIFAFSFIYCYSSFFVIPPPIHSTLVVYHFSELYSIVFHPTFSCSKLHVLFLLPTRCSLMHSLYRPIKLPHHTLTILNIPYSTTLYTRTTNPYYTLPNLILFYPFPISHHTL